MTEVYLSLGSNVEPEANLRLAVRELRRRYGELRISPVYRNEAVGFEGDDFLNLVVRCEVDCSVTELSDDLESIHELAGRRRSEAKFSSRTLDIDILLFGALVSDGPPCRLPRPDVLGYDFVLKPLADIAPHGLHPETGRSFSSHWHAMEPDAHELHPLPMGFD